MIKYFCDNCGKDITNEKEFDLTVTFERPSSFFERKVTTRRSRIFCEKCSEEITKEILEIIKSK
jgi:hypothetical protein